MIYAVIDTNVLVSALLSRHSDAATVQVVKAVFEKNILPLYNDEIIAEYEEVLGRKKFGFPYDEVKNILDMIIKMGTSAKRTPVREDFPDPKDVVFYEITMSKEDAYLVTGNTKHFPKSPIVVTPAEMLDILSREIV